MGLAVARFFSHSSQLFSYIWLVLEGRARLGQFSLL